MPRDMTAAELIAKAAACTRCGEEHPYRRIGPNRATWAHRKDGHYYRPAIGHAQGSDVIALLRYFHTGKAVSAWTPVEDNGKAPQ